MEMLHKLKREYAEKAENCEFCREVERTISWMNLPTVDKKNSLTFYAMITIQWLSGNGMRYIIVHSIKQYQIKKTAWRGKCAWEGKAKGRLEGKAEEHSKIADTIRKKAISKNRLRICLVMYNLAKFQRTQLPPKAL